MRYDFKTIEKKWQDAWASADTFRVKEDPSKPPYYVLGMFPYPSGSGLHVGHPLGYIATDIVARYKRSKGYNVLHPMGFDAFGLPAEQYAIQEGKHPAHTTAENAQRYRQQLQRLGLSYDWHRTLQTSDPDYYRWTQWVFVQLFNHWYDRSVEKARPISVLIEHLDKHGTQNLEAACSKATPAVDKHAWAAMLPEKRSQFLLHYRLAFLEDTTVNWCPALNTVLSNDEVVDGLSERGGHSVVQKQMQQWSLRITAYAERLLHDLSALDWPEATKQMQRHWIGKSSGAQVHFHVSWEGAATETLRVFTTRPETIFGVTYLALAPEHPLVSRLTSKAHASAVSAYLADVQHRSERERMAEDQPTTGVFTGCYAIHPFTKAPLPIWIADYVLADYGCGAVMGVPAHDVRDDSFARHHQIPIKGVIELQHASSSATDGKAASVIVNSAFLNGLDAIRARARCIEALEAQGCGTAQTVYRLRDAIFSRQRYWGEPIPVGYRKGIPYTLSASELPLKLPYINRYAPTASGQPPLKRAASWTTPLGDPLECCTMPGWAGSSWYFLRYMDPDNGQALVSKQAQAYWGNVDLYIGGAEHATGHLLYARFWTKFLYDIGSIDFAEPFQEVIHQGIIQTQSKFVYRIKHQNTFLSEGLKDRYETTAVRVPSQMVEAGDILDQAALRAWRPELEQAQFILEDGVYRCGTATEKMSKSKHNTVNPDDVITRYGADTLRLHTMFLGPLSQSKPWNTEGIEGVHRFLKRLYKHFQGKWQRSDVHGPLGHAARKVMHSTIKRIEESLCRHSFNTAISTLMSCLNELVRLDCKHVEALEPLAIMLHPFAPHLAESLWEQLGHSDSITHASFPKWDPACLKEDTWWCAVSINGRARAKIELPAGATQALAEKRARADKQVLRWLKDTPVKRVVFIPGRILNLVV